MPGFSEGRACPSTLDRLACFGSLTAPLKIMADLRKKKAARTVF
jgi:hypothetical protein